MAIIPMKKAQLVYLKTVEPLVLEYLQKQNAFEPISSLDNGENEVSLSHFREISKRVADLEFVIRTLAPFSSFRAPVSDLLLGGREVLSEDEVQTIASQMNIDEVIAETQEQDIALQKTEQRMKEITQNRALIAPFVSFDQNISAIRNTEILKIRFFSFKKEEFVSLQKNCKEASLALEWFLTSENKTHIFSVCVLHKDEDIKLSEIIKKYDVSEIMMMENISTLQETKDILEKEFSLKEKERQEILEKFSLLSEELQKIKVCYDFYLWEKERYQVSSEALSTKFTVVLYGFINMNRYKSIQLEIEQITQGGATLSSIESEEGEEIPVEIENPPYLTPFESVTRIYGLPKVSEMDPTPYISVFFLVFFGFCLTDAIYGLILLILSLAILKFFTVPRETKGMIQLLALCGGATTIMGLLFGGYAGIENVPEFLLSFQIFDMNSGINSVMAFAYILGFIHLWFGTLIAGVHKWKQGEKREAFYLHFSWTIFFILIAFSFLGEDATISSLLRNIALVFLFLSLSYDAVWYLKPVKGLIMLMNEGVSWLSQVLSYTRLFALGLSTGVVALVFNQLAVIIGDMLPSGIGMVVMVIFILAGHLLNIAMNLLGAYIHSARLQFVEFFSKFLEGGGRKFAPFTRSSAYVYVENK